MPCIFFIKYFFMTIGVKLGDTITARGTTIISVLFLILSYIILIQFPKFKMVLFGMSIFGIGNGLGNLSVIKNCWQYFPNNKALINGIILTGFGISSSFYSFMADIIINYEKEPTNKEGYYSITISNNLITFLKFNLYTIIFLGSIAIILSFPFKKETNEENLYNDISIKQEIDKTEENNNDENIFEAFFSIPNLELAIICFCGPCKIFINIFYISN